MQHSFTNKFKMKNILSKFALLFSLLYLLSSFIGAENTFTSTHLSTVVINTNPEKTKELVNQLLADNQVILEYSCNYSGVIVIKIKHNFNSVGDVKGYLIRKFGDYKPETAIIFCDLHNISLEGKC